jgi:hypothetical protein
MPAEGRSAGEAPDATDAGGQSFMVITSDVAVGAHTTPAPTPRPAATSTSATPSVPPLAKCRGPPPAAAGCWHRFPGSHGPSEQKVKEPW